MASNSLPISCSPQQFVMVCGNRNLNTHTDAAAVTIAVTISFF
ncbi:hypothetical protein HMPREF9244_01434 [Alloscardovia omnicolens F0580]|uniref:Uncharacterized protein n=1 Tax=Alloscardovia omnicolens F0580 TaxID=1321816 RepID=U1R8V3_9BIFI|nr:hypothetical protein HMPREF9244_01434 [Alloscardovia omnicolens F0580]